jgi:tRNA 2-selenouridine synthase
LQQQPIFDVRSPGEFEHAHIPGAYSLPLFSNEERAEVGTLYKQKGKKLAIKAGLDFFGPKMSKIIASVEGILKSIRYNDTQIVVHCWRGGMRSAGIAWLLDLYGYDVLLLVGGYKSYRKWALERFQDNYHFNILGGYTGSAKTETLQHMESAGATCIDLEALANHKGSAFGGIGLPAQPTQEMFENILALELHRKSNNKIWMEDESQRIGILNIPHPLWATIRQQPLYFLDIPFEQRLQFITEYYGRLPKEKLIEAVVRIQKRFGPNETKMTLSFLLDDNKEEAFRLLLKYYDKEYLKSMQKRENLDRLLTKYSSSHTHAEANALLLLNTK